MATTRATVMGFRLTAGFNRTDGGWFRVTGRGRTESGNDYINRAFAVAAGLEAIADSLNAAGEHAMQNTND